MLRFLMVMALLGIIFSLFKKIMRYFLHKNLAPSFHSASLQDETLIRCATCQIFVPLSKAIQRNDRYYCCENHIVR